MGNFTPFTPYKAPFWAFNGHISTILNALLRKQPPINYKKELFNFKDSDITQLNWLKQESQELIIIIPGMGSEATRNYITNTAYYLFKNNYDVLVPDHRDTSIANKKVKSYHSANYEDLKEIIDSIPETSYKKIHLVGYCLGGSITLNYIYRYPKRINKTITISAPLELKNSSKALEAPNNFLYQRRFVNNLKAKLLEKAKQYPNEISLKAIKDCRTIEDIDNAYTAPVNGFRDADDYYHYGSASNFLDKINTSLLVISSCDDTFIPISEATIKKMNDNKGITPLITKKGGHVAYPNSFMKGIFWHEKQILQFISN